ncbi:uncharacterized protein LOC123528457 isoform X1 [Mercenaria mercenaria]|uniref:uncharacterized protein LOC123528457 isoform X1 n=1 Tax=Mercenaria mercenaria TaxID=6596 RepID=UPI00234ECB7C|nr:uncharacterized protein LOC123528457 isoform X1 [Mercenaria mercenaria]
MCDTLHPGNITTSTLHRMCDTLHPGNITISTLHRMCDTLHPGNITTSTLHRMLDTLHPGNITTSTLNRMCDTLHPGNITISTLHRMCDTLHPGNITTSTLHRMWDTLHPGNITTSTLHRMWDTLHPDEAYAAAEFGFPAPGSDMDVEMTQEKVNTRCPYTGMEMVYPVRNKHCGHNYDKDGIQQYIKQRKKKAKCPLGGCSNEKPIEMSDLEENKELKRYIERMNRNVKKGKK